MAARAPRARWSHEHLHQYPRGHRKHHPAIRRNVPARLPQDIRTPRRRLQRVGAAAPFQGRAQGPGPYPDPNFRQLDSWIAIREDNTATFFVGKTDLGQGTGTAFRQIMCDELDMAYDRTSCVMGSTDVTVDQGGSGGSDALQVDGYPMRRVAAEARRVLLDMAAVRFAVPVSELSVRDGVVSVTAEPSRRVTYGQLIGGRRFNVALTGDNATAATGTARLKNVQDLKSSGQPLPRYDIPPKVDGSLKWAVDVKLPGMVHARNVKPPFAGATLTASTNLRSGAFPASCESSGAATISRWSASARSRPFRRRRR